MTTNSAVLEVKALYADYVDVCGERKRLRAALAELVEAWKSETAAEPLAYQRAVAALEETNGGES